MARVLISLLGTGKIAKGDNNKNEYVATDYKINNVVYRNKTLVSSAIIEHYKVDKLFIIGTKESMWDNLCTLFETHEEYTLSIIEKKENGSLQEEDLSQLSNAIDTTQNAIGSKCYIVQDSETEEQLWKMFDKFLEILSTISHKDEVYFDITHLFRSVSVLTMIMAEFGSISHDIKISGIFYGMLKKDEPSSIVDLRVFFEILQWARALKSLKLGNSFELMQLIDVSNESKELKNSFRNFSNALSISDIGAMQQSIAQLKGKIALFANHNSHLYKLISNDLQEFIKRFDLQTLAKFQYELAKWYAENHNYSFAYISLAEAAVSAICEKNNLNSTSKDDREEAKKILWNYKFTSSGSKEKDKIYNAFDKVNNTRVNIAHKLDNSGSRSKSSPSDSIKNISDYLKTLEKLF